MIFDFVFPWTLSSLFGYHYLTIVVLSGLLLFSQSSAFILYSVKSFSMFSPKLIGLFFDSSEQLF